MQNNNYSTIFYFIIIIIFIVWNYYLFNYHYLYFINSNYLPSLTTIIVGSIAIFLYLKQKNDFKRDAANIILMEIRDAENKINIIKSGKMVTVEEILLPTNNWVKYNYLFISDLDRDELDLINNFYNQCVLIDKSLSQLSLTKQLEQKSSYIHQKIVQIAWEKSQLQDDNQKIQDIFNKEKNKFLNLIQNDKYAFIATVPQESIITASNNINSITTSSAGIKLKNIAKIS